MTFTGTLITSLMAAVERAERHEAPETASAAVSMTMEDLTTEVLAMPAWFAAAPSAGECDSKLLGVA